ncbi:Prefoldin [Pseudocohnilembus persalinus]|uniref:Prefoldin n=1 Tax=Pseudocohnilembus persalinus TaxID=266149 RepID=A0A0V0QEA4_PSEPJ|nr:Prefoldin [Pseudocohnilembus persalinus]|eukprot:KRX00535.1 Prefoldin [Pseudocohnilembus persalinus]
MSTDRESQARLLLELERDLMVSAQKVKLYDNSINYLKKNILKSQITMKELTPLNDDHKTFRPLGRAFIQKGKQDILEELELVIKGNNDDIQEYNKHKEEFTKKTMDLDKKLQEAIQKYQAMKK